MISTSCDRIPILQIAIVSLGQLSRHAVQFVDTFEMSIACLAFTQPQSSASADIPSTLIRDPASFGHFSVNSALHSWVFCGYGLHDT